MSRIDEYWRQRAIDAGYEHPEPRHVYRGYDGKRRDEFSCPCCGIENDSHECDECRAAECGEQEDYAGCLAKVSR